VLTLVFAALLFEPGSVFAKITDVHQARDVYILSVGVNQTSPRPGAFNALYAEADASELAPALGKWLDFDHAGNITISTLLGRQATLAAIRDAMRRIATKAGPDDIFVFNFDGPGLCRPESRGYEFATYDTMLLPDGSVQNALNSRDLGALLVQIPAVNQFVVIDTCGSHKALDDLRAALQPPEVEGGLLVRQVHLLSPDGMSYEDAGLKGGHGRLTSALLDGLAGGADVDHSGKITWDRLVGYVTWKLPESDTPSEHLYALTIYGDEAPPPPPQSPTRGVVPESSDSSPDTNGLGQDYALLVGTDHYTRGWPTLNNPFFDVSSLRDELVRDYGFRNDADHIIVRHDAKKHDIDPAIEKLIGKKFDKNDRLLVYIAGHGYRTFMNGQNLEGYVVFSDSKLPEAEDATDGMESFGDLTRILDRIKVPHLLLVLDVCYGGLFDGETNGVKTSFFSQFGNSTDEMAPPNELIQRALNAHSRIYITSGDENHQVSDGDPGQHSPFSRRFLAALQENKATQPYLDVAHLFNKLRSLPREPRAGYFYENHVEQNADYIFIPRPQSVPASASAAGE
jgi:uncharacterized caspase-like protein